jgi:PAS domain-containing protein
VTWLFRLIAVVTLVQSHLWVSGSLVNDVGGSIVGIPQGQGAEPEIGFYTWDVIENQLVMDRVCAELFELPPIDAAAGLTIEVFLDKIDEITRRRVAKAIHDCLVSGNFYDEEYPVILKNGNVRWVKVVGRFVLNAENEPLRGIGTTIDITARRLAAAKLTRQ